MPLPMPASLQRALTKHPIREVRKPFVFCVSTVLAFTVINFLQLNCYIPPGLTWDILTHSGNLDAPPPATTSLHPKRAASQTPKVRFNLVFLFQQFFALTHHAFFQLKSYIPPGPTWDILTHSGN